MNMIPFNFAQFCRDKRVNLPVVANKTGVSYVGVWEMAKRESIKATFLGTLESHFGDCSKYIIKSKKRTTKVA